MDSRMSTVWIAITLMLMADAAKGQASTQSLGTFAGHEYFKVPARGTMTSANVKATCDAAGMLTPCSGPSNCQYSTGCDTTGLTLCSSPMSQVIGASTCGDTLAGCTLFNGVYMYLYGWANGGACGIENFGGCVNGNQYTNRYAICARNLADVDGCSPNPCVANATCVDNPRPTQPAATCTCGAGYEGDGLISGGGCTDFNACASNPCHAQANCTDNPAPALDFTCTCNDGYTGDGSPGGSGCSAPTYLGTFAGYEYFKVPATGQMTSANVKATCDAAGMLTPCPGDSFCQRSSPDCVTTGLTQCSFPMNEVSFSICGANPSNCPPFDGVYQFYANWQGGSACGVEMGSWCAVGNGYGDRFAFCARNEDVDGCSPNPCDAQATCTDNPNPTPGANCTCGAGYEGDGLSSGSGCTDINACAPNPCHEQATCVDKPPPALDATCTCRAGYTGDGLASGSGCTLICPSGFDDHWGFGKCLYVHKKPRAYQAAKTFCQNKGGQLFLLDNSADVTKLKAIMTRITTQRGRKRGVWIGLTDSATEGTFQWEGGAALGAYNDWETGSPTGNTAGRDCVQMKVKYTWKWIVSSCTDRNAFICKATLRG